jgi:diguanylate cyclase (GGDEF)-like protein/PAS domain S-box-containing protein
MHFAIDSLYFWLLPIVALILAYNAFYAWRQPHSPGVKFFALSCLTLTLWVGSDHITRFAVEYSHLQIAENLKYLGITTGPVLYLIFAFKYKGYKLSPKTIATLFVIPFVTNVVIWTNDSHQLFWRELRFVFGETPYSVFGQYFWYFHMPYSYSCMAVSIALFAKDVFTSSRFHRVQTLIITVGTILPLLSNILYLSGLTGGKSYMSLSLALYTLTVNWGLFRWQFLKSRPIAYEAVFQTMRDCVVVLSRENVITDVNPAALRQLSKKPEQVIGRHAGEVFSSIPGLFDHYEAMVKKKEETSVFESGNGLFVELSITPLQNRTSEPIGSMVMARDITDRIRHSKTLENFAYRDPLTQIANRHLFEIEAQRSLNAAKAAEKGGSLAVVFFDLNQFKSVNDTYGHEVGDQLLKYLSYRVGARLESPDMIARLGGDEFILLLHDADQDRVRAVMANIFREMQRPFEIKEHCFHISLSAGAAFFPEHGCDISTLMRHADSAMYRAKAGGGGLEFFDMQTFVRVPGRIPLDTRVSV